MNLNLDQALAELRNNPSRYNSYERLTELVSHVSVIDPTVPLDARTVTYSGWLNGSNRTHDMALGYAAESGARIIDNTPAGEFIASRDFRNAVEHIAKQSIPPELAGDPDAFSKAIKEATGNYLYSTDESLGPWANRSGPFIDAARNGIDAFTPNSPDGRTWAITEYPRALANENVPDINGLPRESLVDFRNKLLPDGHTPEQLAAVDKQIRDTIDYASRTRIAEIDPTIELKPATPEVLDNFRQSHEQITALTQDKLNLAEAAGDTARSADLLRHMDKLGAVGTAIEVAVIAHDANAAMDNGDTAAAEVIVAEGIAKLAGSTAGGMIAAEIIGAGLMLAGVSLSAPVAIALMVGAGIAGSLAGDKVVDAAIDTLREATGQTPTEPPATPLTNETTGGQQSPGTPNTDNSHTDETTAQNQTPPPGTPVRDIDTPEIIVTTPDRLILSRSAGNITTMTREEAEATTIQRIEQLATDHDRTSGSEHQLSVWRDSDGNITGYQIDSTASNNGQTRNETLVFDASGKLISGGTTVHDNQGLLADVTMTEAQKSIVQNYYETAFEDAPVAATRTDNPTPEQLQSINEQHPQPIQAPQTPTPLITDLNPDAP